MTLVLDVEKSNHKALEQNYFVIKNFFQDISALFLLYFIISVFVWKKKFYFNLTNFYIFYCLTWEQYEKNQYQSVTVLRMKFSIEISQYHLFVNFVTIQIKIQKQTNKNFYFYRLLYVNRLRCGLIKNPDTENTGSIFAEVA
ncbi:hypothetical protein BpHYR1_032474 [Brachionus plicatilis]|uniref:Transmembrane protein n=1 Tax=Brachionus plicatilis TaxID=10195 RepID=A0A3M7SNP6_BRAPC|nr:hypothetical protein BpHYR1_032474 [Brachionus plicatilis]